MLYGASVCCMGLVYAVWGSCRLYAVWGLVQAV